MNSSIFRIALIGPESTGKTTLSRELADYYKTVWVPEFARDYILNLGQQYKAEDIIHCTVQQEKNEDALMKKAVGLLFSDTEEILAQVWIRDSFQINSSWMEEQIQNRPFDFYLLCKPDLPFEPDLVRENPHRRDYFFNLYKQELETRIFPYVIIEGQGPARLQNAIEKIDNFIRNNQRKR